MSQDQSSARKAIEREKARLLKEAALKAAEAAEAARKAEQFARDMEEAERIATTWGITFSRPDDSAVAGAQRAISKSNHDKLVTIGDLIDAYIFDDRSPYKKVRFNTRKYYDTLLKRSREDCGTFKLAELDAQAIQNLYDSWTKHGTDKLSLGRSLTTMLRGLFSFGDNQLKDEQCERLSFAMHKMHFAVVKGRERSEITQEDVEKIIKQANKTGWGSIALAQAFQWSCAIRQKDVVGEWVPFAEPGISTVVYKRLKWIRGLRWEEIDDNFILKHVSTEKEFVIDLKRAPLVMAQLDNKPRSAFPRSGPVIVRETTGRPWVPDEFRKMWRTVARGCGIPDEIKNTDSLVRTENAVDRRRQYKRPSTR